MDNYKKELIKEHKELVKRINVLENKIYTEDAAYINNVEPLEDVNIELDNYLDRIEYINRRLQLDAMKRYESALSARIHNCNIEIAGNNYYEKIDE